MAATKSARKGLQKSKPHPSTKRNGRTILQLGKVGKIKLADIRRAVLEVRKRRLAAGR
jgi:hypothetical protein